MLEHCRRHRPAVAETAELPATLAGNGSAADVLGNVQCREESYRAAAVLRWQVPDRLTGVRVSDEGPPSWRWLAEQTGQLGDVRRDPSRLILESSSSSK